MEELYEKDTCMYDFDSNGGGSGRLHRQNNRRQGNSSAEALRELLKEGSLAIDMNDYAGMEKVGSIGTSLPRNDEQIETGAGDIILYQGNSLVIYYDTNSWNFTRIGKIDGVSQAELLDALGDGDVTVTFSLE